MEYERIDKVQVIFFFLFFEFLYVMGDFEVVVNELLMATFIK